jgi:hypothetical protein
MTPPSFKVRMLGHPLSVLIALLFAGWISWECYLRFDTTAIFMGLGTLWTLAAVMRASEQRQRYRVWQRECAVMEGRSPPRETHYVLALGMLAMAGAALDYAWCENLLPVINWHQILGLGELAAGALVAAIVVVSIVGWLWRPLTRPRYLERPVRVVPRRGRANVPSLAQAYGDLPPYCQRLLRGRE